MTRPAEEILKDLVTEILFRTPYRRKKLYELAIEGQESLGIQRRDILTVGSNDRKSW